MKNYGKIFLIPNFLDANNPDDFISELVRRSVNNLKNFIVENEKAGRALIKRLKILAPQADLKIWILDEHTRNNEISALLAAVEAGNDAGLLSDAGLPCLADPGADFVLLAHHKKIKVVPLPGASSITMALIASGLGGQSFAFSGYLPINKSERIKRIKQLEEDSIRKRQTQLFMETPYRNNHLFADLISNCKAGTFICVACNISCDDEFIKTMSVADWRTQIPELHKKPCIFVLKAQF